MASGRFPGPWENPEIHKHLVTPSRGPVTLATPSSAGAPSLGPTPAWTALPLRPPRKDRASEKRGKGGNSGEPGRPDQPLQGRKLSGGQQEVQAGVQDIKISGSSSLWVPPPRFVLSVPSSLWRLAM